MALPPSLRARDAVAAARASVVVLAASAVVVAGAAVLDPVNRTVPGQIACWTAVALLLCGVLACRLVPAGRLDAHGGLLAIPLVGAVLVNATNLATGDTSAAAQVFLVMPTLLGAAKFRAVAASLVTTAAVAGNAVVTLLLADPVRAVTDSLFTGTALITLTVVLVSAERRREELVRVLQQQATIDALTGLVTRRALDDAVAGAVGTPPGTALVLVDIDRFKAVNDVHGHPVGDAALAHVAAVLAGAVRRSDAVLGRMGGDELALLMRGCSATAAVGRARQVLEAVRATPLELPDGSLLALSVSLGVAHVDADGDASGLYAAADEALYRAKRGGRDQLAVAGA
ncbi:GGDEF domain-containing protein [Modestobacter sp. SYSU DS0511]